MSYSDYLQPQQFGKHRATVTRPDTIRGDKSGRQIEVAASRTTPVDLSYQPKHRARK